MSNSNYNLSLTANAEWGGQEIELTFDPYNDCTDMDELRALAVDEFEPLEPEEEDGEETVPEPDDITIVITDYDDVPNKYANEKDVWEFAAAFAECDQEIDVVEAALECGIDPSNIDEAYAGSYKDDEDFAYETAESLGSIDKNAGWPMNCIDWKYAAKELMYDYSEHDGYYFRNL